MIETGLAWLDGQRDRHLGRIVTYRRGSDEVPVRATVGRTEHESIGDRGLIVKHESRDFLVRVEDLVIGQPTEPRRGDVIIDRVGGVDVVCEVSPLAPGEPEWRFHDRFQRVYRITTRIVDRDVVE